MARFRIWKYRSSDLEVAICFIVLNIHIQLANSCSVDVHMHFQ